MRPTAAFLAVLALAAAGCDRAPVIIERAVTVTLTPLERKWSSRGPQGTTDYHWPYATLSMSGGKAPGEWPGGLAYFRDQSRINDVEIRFFDAPDGVVKVVVDFTGPVSPDLAMVVFKSVASVDDIVVLPKGNEGERPFAGWTLKEDEFQVRAPALGGKIEFLARLR